MSRGDFHSPYMASSGSAARSFFFSGISVIVEFLRDRDPVVAHNQQAASRHEERFRARQNGTKAGCGPFALLHQIPNASQALPRRP